MTAAMRIAAETPRAAEPPASAMALVVERVQLAAEGEAAAPALAVVEARLAGAAGAPRRRLAQVFGLAVPELDLLDLATALAVDPELGRLYARLQGDPARRCPTEALVRELFDCPGRPVWRPGSPLAIWGLLRPVERLPGEAMAFEADPRVVEWLHGTVGLDEALVGCARLVSREPPLPGWPVEQAARELRRALEAGAEARMVISGGPGSGRATFAAAVAGRLGRAALAIDPEAAAPAAEWPDLFMRAQRLALIGDLALVWRAAGGRAWPGHLLRAPLQLVLVEPRQPPAPCPGAADLHIALPSPGAEERGVLWRRLVPRSAGWSPSAVRALAAAAGATVGDIAAVAKSEPAGAEEASARLRARLRTRLSEAGRILEPVFGWDDLVLPEAVIEALRSLAFEARTRERLLTEAAARRLYARGASLAALFSGPPGTGKTMAAQVIAADLGVDLVVVDLAATVSKYIGETAKNLSRIFDRAGAGGAVLLFDEADALFAKRTEVKDAHDRYANADTNHLLQLLEAFDGVAILATNRRANVDPAFVRRVRHVIEFPRPGQAERLELWRRLVAAVGGAEAVEQLAPLLGELARELDLSPAQIKGAALSAKYAAMRTGTALDRASLLRGLERELAKEGRTLGRRGHDRQGRHG